MKQNIGLFWYVVLVVIALALSFGLTYVIATSDMPDWLKFWLLK